MKECWTKDTGRILLELIDMVELEVPLTIFNTKNEQQMTTVGQHVCGFKGVDYFVIQKPGEWKPPTDECFILYKKEGQPARGFKLTVGRESGTHLAVLIPEEIFQIQRRRYPRIDTPADAKATFLCGGKQLMSTVRIQDVSLGGARLLGNPAYVLEVGNEIGPITLTLTLEKYKTDAYDITVPLATVRRVLERPKQGIELGILFDLPKNRREPLARYIDLRQWELDQAKETDLALEVDLNSV